MTIDDPLFCKIYGANVNAMPTQNRRTYAGPLQTSKMENFPTVGNGFWPLAIVKKLSILDVTGES